MRCGKQTGRGELAVASGIAPSTMAAIENDPLPLGIQGAGQLARALPCHPPVLVFPGWSENAA